MEKISLPHFKPYDTATVSESIWYWWRDRHKDQWNKKHDREIDSHKYAKEQICLFKNGAGTMGYPYVKNEPLLKSHTLYILKKNKIKMDQGLKCKM